MSEEFDENPITSKYLLIRTDNDNFEIMDQYEQKFIVSENLITKMGRKEHLKMGQDLDKGLEILWYSLTDSTNTPIGEITLQQMDRNLTPVTIKNSLGETVATVTSKSVAEVIIETPTRKFMVVKRSTKKYTTKIKVVDEKENHCFSIIPEVKDDLNTKSKGLFEINIFEGFLDLNPFIICTTSFLISQIYWPVKF